MKNIKKAVFIRVVMIGMLHTFLYLWLVPFAIYPRFGNNGFMFTVAVAAVISISMVGTLFVGRKKRDKPEESEQNMAG
ncbi:MAG: hypothetical protein AB7U45_11420 [Desulfamplus sp.]